MKYVMNTQLVSVLHTPSRKQDDPARPLLVQGSFANSPGSLTVLNCYIQHRKAGRSETQSAATLESTPIANARSTSRKTSTPDTSSTIELCFGRRGFDQGKRGDSTRHCGRHESDRLQSGYGYLYRLGIKKNLGPSTEYGVHTICTSHHTHMNLQYVGTDNCTPLNMHTHPFVANPGQRIVSCCRAQRRLCRQLGVAHHRCVRTLVKCCCCQAFDIGTYSVGTYVRRRDPSPILAFAHTYTTPMAFLSARLVQMICVIVGRAQREEDRSSIQKVPSHLPVIMRAW